LAHYVKRCVTFGLVALVLGQSNQSKQSRRRRCGDSVSSDTLKQMVIDAV